MISHNERFWCLSDPHLPVKFGKMTFMSVHIVDRFFAHAGCITSAQFAERLLTGEAGFFGEDIFFDEPIAVPRTNYCMLASCTLMAPEGCLPFDVEHAIAGGDCRFGFPKASEAGR